MTKSAEVVGETVVCLFAVIGVIISIAGIGLLLAFPIKWTWNATMPYLFAFPTISWGKAWCIHFLAGCLIKSTSSHKKD